MQTADLVDSTSDLGSPSTERTDIEKGNIAMKEYNNKFKFVQDVQSKNILKYGFHKSIKRT